MQEIARRAGVAATTLYRRWPSKEKLLLDAFALVRTTEERPIGAYDEITYDELVSLMTELTPDLLGRADLGKLIARLIGSAERLLAALAGAGCSAWRACSPPWS